MGGWLKTKTGEPTTAKGGDLEAGFQAAGWESTQAVRAVVLAAVQKVVDDTVAKSAPGARDGWPIGPPRPWEGAHVHSYTLFVVEDRSRGWFLNVQIVNRADYATFIHERGNRKRIVWEREIMEPLESGLDRLKRDIQNAIQHAWFQALVEF